MIMIGAAFDNLLARQTRYPCEALIRDIVHAIGRNSVAPLPQADENSCHGNR